MRLLHVIPFITAQHGGPALAVRQMAAHVHRLHGVEVEVVSTDAEGSGRAELPLNEPIVEAGVTYRHFPRQSRFYSVSLPLSAWLANNVNRFDLLHIHGLFSYADTVAAWHAHRNAVPYIVRPFGVLETWGIKHRRPLLKQLSLRLIEKPIMRRAALAHYTSRQEQRTAEALGVRTPALVAPLAIPIPPETEREPLAQHFLETYPVLRGNPWVLFLSRFHPKKGLDLLIPAFAKVVARTPAAMLVLAGDGDPAYLETLRAMVRQAGIEANVLWTGFLQGEMKRAAFAAAPLFVLPSWSENFGIAVVEALAAGTPVIVSDQVAIHEEISAAGAGTVVSCTIESVAQALSALLDDPEQRARHSAAGKRLAAERFSIQAMADTLYAAYGRVARSV